MAGLFQHIDGLGLRAVAAELLALGEARIDKVGQVAPRAFYLNLRAGGANHRLLLDLRDRWARVHFTKRSFPNVATPTAFAMLLRKHLEGSRVLRVEQPGLERVLELVVAGRDELGDPYERRLEHADVAVATSAPGPHQIWNIPRILLEVPFEYPLKPL